MKSVFLVPFCEKGHLGSDVSNERSLRPPYQAPLVQLLCDKKRPDRVHAEARHQFLRRHAIEAGVYQNPGIVDQNVDVICGLADCRCPFCNTLGRGDVQREYCHGAVVQVGEVLGSVLISDPPYDAVAFCKKLTGKLWEKGFKDV